MSKVPCGGFKLDENFLGMNENDELSLVGGSEGGEGKAYQYVVTDGNGNVKWEDRLAYVATEEQVIFSQENMEFTDAYAEIVSPFGKLIIGNKYTVIWDGVTYENLTAFEYNGYVTIGSTYDSISDDLPFSISTEDGPHDGTLLEISALTSDNTHSVTIFVLVETTHTIPQVYLPKNYRVVFVITYDIEGNNRISSISCNCSYEELKSFCIGKSVPILGSLYDKNEVKELIYIKYIEEDATIYLQFNSGVGNDILKLEYRQDGSIMRPLQ